MQPPSEIAAEQVEKAAFLLLLVIFTLALGGILLPFFGAIMWGAIIALLFTPLYQWLLPRLKHQPTLTALLTLLIVLFIVILPLAFVMAALTHEATLVYQRLQTGELNLTQYFHGLFDALPRWIRSILERFGLINFNELQRRLGAALTQGIQFIATQAFSIGQNTFEFAASFFVTLYLAFFLIRDGECIGIAIRRAIPLAPERKQELINQLITVIEATVKGNLLVATIQGTLGGIAFWFLGVSGALLWAVLMAVLSLLPAIGAGLVWLPVAIYFIITGALWQGIALAVYGLLVIGLVDNLLRPILVGKNTHLPDYMVMLTTVGGIAVFGINGFVLGPVIAAMFIATWHMQTDPSSAVT